MVWLRQAVASGAYPRRIEIGSSPESLAKMKREAIASLFIMVRVFITDCRI